MNDRFSVRLALCVATSFGFTELALAEVKSLSSSELTETYIQDSTIIITPKQAPATTKREVSSITIAPVESTEQDFIELENSQLHQDGTVTSFELDEDTLRNASVETAINPAIIPEVATYQDPDYATPIADILDDERYRAPEGDFDYEYIGDDLGLSRVGDKLTFSIGNIPGIDKIELPNAVNEELLQIIPRAGGGFDLTINVPQDN